MFVVGDLVDLPSLASKLKQPNRAFDLWLAAQLSSATKAALANYQGQGSDPAPVQQALLQDFNGLIRSASLYEPPRFVDIALRPETTTLMSKNPQGADLERLNRLLFEDAYPLELAKIPQGSTAKQWQKVTASILLWVVTIGVAVIWFGVLNRIEEQLHADHSVEWTVPANAELKPGPPAFAYDRGNNTLYYKGAMDASTKQQLLSLLVSQESPTPTEVSQPYFDAINRLAYEANDGAGRTLSFLLLLGGLSATLGALFRLMLSFVNVICYKNALDLALWWPYYVLRPPVGFLIGLTVVLLVKAELLFKGEVVAAAGSLWWAGVAFIAGFAASEFTDWLITMSRTFFRPGDIRDKAKT